MSQDSELFFLECTSCYFCSFFALFSSPSSFFLSFLPSPYCSPYPPSPLHPPPPHSYPWACGELVGEKRPRRDVVHDKQRDVIRLDALEQMLSHLPFGHMVNARKPIVDWALDGGFAAHFLGWACALLFLLCEQARGGRRGWVGWGGGGVRWLGKACCNIESRSSLSRCTLSVPND